MVHSLTESERDLLLAGWKGIEKLDSSTGDSSLSRACGSQGTGAAIQGLMTGFSTRLRDALRDFTGREFRIEAIPAGRPVGIESPGAFQVLQGMLEPLEEPICLKFEAGFLDPLLERLLGGGMSAESEKRRVLTPIELRLTQRLGALAAEALTQSLQGGSGVPLAVGELHVAADRSRGPAGPEWCWGGVQVEGGGASGRVIWGLSPQAAEVLSPQREPVSRPAPGIEEEPGTGELSVVLAELELSDEEVAGLSIGDILVTGRGTEEPLKVLVDGTVVFAGKAGVWSGRKAVRLSAEGEREGGGAVDSEASGQ